MSTNELASHQASHHAVPTDPEDSLPPSIPTPVTASERLLTVYRSPGPYTTVYLGTVATQSEPSTEAETTEAEAADDAADLDRRWSTMRRELESRGATPEALDAIAARLRLPAPEDTAAVAVIAAADGTTTVDHGLEPPEHDLAVVDTLPYAAPMLEWQQRRIAHLVVTLDDEGADIATFGLDHYTRIDTYEGNEEALVEPISRHADAIRSELVILVGETRLTQPLADRLVLRLHVDCRVLLESGDQTVDELVDATVRHVSDTAARKTVRYLREQRFLAGHDASVEGTAQTVTALSDGSADLLLIHDDPDDNRRVWIGDGPRQLSTEERPDHGHSARLVDAAIRSAILQGTPVHIIPTTGPNGPDDNAAALTDLGEN